MPFIDSSGTPIYYEDYDTRPESARDMSQPALIFAHGAGGNTAVWFNQLAYFAPRYRTVAFDHRCFGRTPVTEGITVHQFRDDLLALMDQLEIERAHLVGQSMGGFTVMRTVLDAPDRVASVTMSATAGGIINENPTPALQNLTRSDDDSSSDEQNSGGVLETMSQDTTTQPALMQLYASITQFNINFSWDKLRNLLGREDIISLDQLNSITCPVLFIAGDEDPLFPADLLAGYVPHFRQSTIQVVKDSGHSPYFEQPDVFNELLAAHLSTS